MQITLNKACLAQNSNLLTPHSIQQLSEAQDRIEKFTEEKRGAERGKQEGRRIQNMGKANRE